ncbi:MAG: hypothetical protein KC561_13215 [Myxococcales bacterium]|nr:hypothetical protein [Myxococcales bacterium]
MAANTGRVVGRNGEVQIEVANLEAPSLVLSSNWMHAMIENGSFQMVFGQRAPYAEDFSAALVVELPVGNVEKALGSGEFFQLLAAEEHVEISEMRLTSRNPFPPERTLFERATFVSFAYMDEDAEVRFFRLSASDFELLKKGKREGILLVHPVVQVNCSRHTLFSFLSQTMEAISKNREASE